MAAPRPHPLAVAPAARLAGRAIAAIWRSGLSPKPVLEPDLLWQVGARGFEPEDEGGGRTEADQLDFRERLDRLSLSLREEARLNPLGHTMAYGQLTATIRKRHALGRLWRTRPAIAATQIASPVIVVGQMRSGTTRIHRLLAADPAHAGTRFCNSFDPYPAVPDLRPLKAAIALGIGRRINPWLDTLHPFGATRPDEEIGWLSAALSPCAFEAQWHVPAFVRWSESGDAAPIYREFARILRTDAAIMHNACKPRILKCPQFAEDLTVLLAQFPDARVVVAHRASEDVLESAISMVAGQSAFQSDARDLASIRREWERKHALRAQRIEAALAIHRGPVVRVPFAQLDADWRTAVETIYASLGLMLSPDALEAMEREQRSAARSPHHDHGKALARFARAGG